MSETPDTPILTPLQRILAIADAAKPMERPVAAPSPARTSAPKDQTGDGRQAGAPSDLPSADQASEAGVGAAAAPESPEREKNFSPDAAAAQGEREKDSAPKIGEPCADGMTAANVVEFPPSRAQKGRKKKGDKAAGADAKGTDAELFKPRTFGFDIGEMNKQYALVLLGSQAVVFIEETDAPVQQQRRFLDVASLNKWLANKWTERVGADGKVKAVTWATAWLQSRDRRSYRGVEFHPDPKNAPGIDGYLNLWGGFAVKPARPGDPGSYAIFRDHLLTNVCRGDKALFTWLFAFFARMVQRPRERVGVALVFRGKMGSGKTKVGEVIGSLIPRHYCLVDDPRYVTGQFNAHMATCLLLQADEAVWAGDKAAEGRLKGLITAPMQFIEPKGVDAIPLPNYVCVIMTSNENWVVPAGKDERRFAVYDVDPRVAQNHDYFRDMDEQLARGGREHLLADLLAFDLATVNLRQIPHTEALLEQKLHSLDSIDAWWVERLMNGSATRRASEWASEIPCSTLFDDYIAQADRVGIRRKQEETVFGIRLGKLVPGLDRIKRTREVIDHEDGGRSVTKRVWCYRLPPLAEARAHVEAMFGQKLAWLQETPSTAENVAAPADGGDDDVVL